MKNRERQRRNKQIKEQRLARRDICGVNDPTPYEAVRSIIAQKRKANGR